MWGCDGSLARCGLDGEVLGVFGSSRVAARGTLDARDSPLLLGAGWPGRASEAEAALTAAPAAAASDALLLTRTPLVTVTPNGERGSTVISVSSLRCPELR